MWLTEPMRFTEMCSTNLFDQVDALRQVDVDCATTAHAYATNALCLSTTNGCTASTTAPCALCFVQVMRCHQAFLVRAADGALLTQLPVLKCVVDLQRCAHDLWREGSVLTVRAEGAGQGEGGRC